MKMNRREFLKSGVLMAGTGLAGGIPLSAAPAASDRILVVINLYGGNDGLNTLIPLNQYDRYKQLRPRLAVDKSSALTLANAPDFGLHPSMPAMLELYRNNKVAIVAGVGVPKNAAGLFDHEAGQFEFQTCDLSYSLSPKKPSGWLGRYLDRVEPGLIEPGVDLGGGRVLMTGEAHNPVSITSLEEFRLKFSFDGAARKSTYQGIMNAKRQDPVAELNRKLRVDALRQSATIRSRTSGYTSAVTYPNTYLGGQLAQCATLIWGDLGVKAMAVATGEYDTHFGQLGVHDRLLKDLSDSISAFHADLTAHDLADRVLILTISEFGRRVYENNDIGTDHGYASIAFAIGNMVKPGVFGGYPGLSDSNLVFDGNVDVNTDFRSVYSTVLARFLDADPSPVVRGNFPQLGFL